MSHKLSGLKPPSKIAKPSNLPSKTPGTSGSLSKSLTDNQPLTLNTDDFIIGDRVWVSGTKPGYIQYIGETQFAPGEWAGVVLDEPIGKNDGSVAGIRYFMCEPKRGVFSRLTKLTRAQFLKFTSSSSDTGGNGECKDVTDGLGQSEGSESLEVRSDVDSCLLGDESKTNNGADDSYSTPESRSASNGISIPPENLSLLSPKLSSMGKILPNSQMKRSNSPGLPLTSKTPTPTPRTPGSTDSSPGPHNLKIGDRVLVSGTKAGVLRYVGLTEFASGEWAGVELDEMLGKNDGSVAGKKYFDCKPKYGLFAPVHKVTKVPGSAPARKLTQRTGLNTSSTLSRTSRQQSGSQESLSSLSSTSSSVRATRVRLGVTSLTSQKSSSRPGTATVTATNTALQEALKEKEQHIDQLLKERDLERAEVARAAAQVDEAERRLANLRSEYDRYIDETDSSMRRINSIIDESERQKSELLAQLDDERRKVEDLQFRIEEESISKGDLESQTKAEEKKIKELEAQLQEFKAKLTNSETELSLLKTSYNSEKSRLNQVEQSSTSYLDQIKELTQQLASSENKVQSLEASSAETGAKANKVSQELSNQRIHLGELEALVEKNCNEIKELTNKNSDLHEKLESSLSTNAKANETITELKAKLATKETSYSEIMAEVQQLKLSMSDVQRNFQASEEKCALLVQDKDKLTIEIAEIMKHSGDSSEQLTAMNEQLREKDKKLEEIQNSLSSANQKTSRLEEMISQQNEKFLQEKNSLIALHQEEYRKWQEKTDLLTVEVKKTSNKMNQLSATHDSSLKDLMKKKEFELVELKKSISSKEDIIVQFNTTITSLKSELENIKIDLYKHRAEKEKLEKLFQIVDADKDGLIRERDRLRADLQGALNNRSESELKLTELAADRDKERGEGVRMREEAINLKMCLEKEKLALSKEKIEINTLMRQKDESINRLNVEIVRLKDEFSKQKEIIEHRLQETQQEATSIQELQSELTLVKRSLEDVRKRNQELEHEKNNYRSELERLRTVQEEKVQLEGKQSSLKKQLDDMKQRETELVAVFESDRANLQTVVDATQKAILQRDRELDVKNSEIIALQGEMSIASTYKTAIHNLEMEKNQLEERMAVLQSALTQSQANANLHPNYNAANDPLIIMLKQEKEAAESQIEFLNSVIVDMQRKNDELASRLEILEAGDFNSSTDLSLENGSHKGSAPRLFCDICDVFDQHDTDDCPRQSMTDSPPSSQYHGNRNETRPYCDICEVFGHWTANCDDNETF